MEYKVIMRNITLSLANNNAEFFYMLAITNDENLFFKSVYNL